MTKSILFDSFAILKYYQDETGADIVEKLLRSAQRGQLKALMSEINLGEVYYLTIRRTGLEPAKENLEQLSASIITGDPEFKKVEHLVSVNWI